MQKTHTVHIFYIQALAGFMTILITVLYRVRFYVLFQFPLFDGTMQANLLEANCQLFLCSSQQSKFCPNSQLQILSVLNEKFPFYPHVNFVNLASTANDRIPLTLSTPITQKRYLKTTSPTFKGLLESFVAFQSISECFT